MERQEPTDRAGADWQAYLKERRLLVDGNLASQRDCDKWLLSLSGGLLTLSLTFLAEFVTNGSAVYTWLLVTSWLFIGTSTITVLLSFRKSADAFEQYRDALDEAFRNYDQDVWLRAGQKQSNCPANRQVDQLNSTSIAAFGIGVMLLIAFMFVNS